MWHQGQMSSVVLLGSRSELIPKAEVAVGTCSGRGRRWLGGLPRSGWSVQCTSSPGPSSLQPCARCQQSWDPRGHGHVSQPPGGEEGQVQLLDRTQEDRGPALELSPTSISSLKRREVKPGEGSRGSGSEGRNCLGVLRWGGRVSGEQQLSVKCTLVCAPCLTKVLVCAHGDLCYSDR